MRINTVDDLERARRVCREAESIFGIVSTLTDENDNLPSPELQDMFDEFFDSLIEFRCSLESAMYEGLDHFDKEVV